jgi:fumarate reductase flavoprotein subunit
MNSSRVAVNRSLKTDIVVIGAGGAGLSAAVSAAEKGAKVIVLEKRQIPGGSTLFAEGPFAAESPTQKRLNIQCTNDELYNIQMYYNHWTLNAKQVREVINKSGDTIRWLEDKGIEFYMPLMYPNQSPLEWHNPKKGCPEIIKVLMKDCQQFGVEVLFKTRARKIITDNAGKVSGVIANIGRLEITIKTKSIIIASGGYGGNNKLIKKYNPLFNVNNVKINILKEIHSGDGIRMAFDIGADSEGLEKLILHGPVPEARGAFGIAIEANSVWVNKNGQRFMQESASFSPFESVNGVLRQPGQVCFSIFDEAMRKNAIKNGLERPFESSLHSRRIMNQMSEGFKDEAASGRMLISHSWDEIAKWIGVPPATLKATIDEYNACCDKGHDDQFAKAPKNLKPLRTPPFYVVKCAPGILSSLGGIKTNHQMEVINKDGEPIIGLYSAGNDACGGFSGATYNVRLAGAGCGFAFNSGRIAGENAARYVLESKHRIKSTSIGGK